MKKDDIILLLTRLPGPLKMQPQIENADFNKFQGMLGAALTQSALEINTTGVQFPDYQSYRLPEEIIEELDKMSDEIAAAQPPQRVGFWNMKSIREKLCFLASMKMHH